MNLNNLFAQKNTEIQKVLNKYPKYAQKIKYRQYLSIEWNYYFGVLFLFLFKWILGKSDASPWEGFGLLLF